MWGVGVIAYFLVMHHPPFESEDEAVLKEKVQTLDYPDIDMMCKEHFNLELRDFIKNCTLIDDPLRRLTASQALVWAQKQVK